MKAEMAAAEAAKEDEKVKEDEELQEDTSAETAKQCEVDGVTYNLCEQGGKVVAVDTIEFTKLGEYNRETANIDFFGEEEEQLHRDNVEEAA